MTGSDPRNRLFRGGSAAACREVCRGAEQRSGLGLGGIRDRRSPVISRDLRLGGLGRYGFDLSYLLCSVLCSRVDRTSTAPGDRGAGRVGDCVLLCFMRVRPAHRLFCVPKIIGAIGAAVVMHNLYVKPGSPTAASPDARTYRREGRLGRAVEVSNCTTIIHICICVDSFNSPNERARDPPEIHLHRCR